MVRPELAFPWCFNGSAAGRRWRAALSADHRTCTLNGLQWSRRPATTESLIWDAVDHWDNELQWSRRRATTESRVQGTSQAGPPVASMGPSSGDDGEAARAASRTRPEPCFNGAVVGRRRRARHELGAHPRQRLASMGPSSGDDGEPRDQGAAGARLPRASMGPSSGDDGETFPRPAPRGIPV